MPATATVTSTASPARIASSKANGARAIGPTSEEGKARSRANSYKHGLTATVVMPLEDAAEVERLSKAFQEELKAEGEVGHALAHRMAVMSVRMDRCVDHENAALTERVRQALDEFEAPEGVDAEEADRLRAEAGHLALFDPSKPATLARKYEAAAERCFFRSLKELRQRTRESAKSATAEVAAQTRSALQQLGSFLPAATKPTPAPAKPVPTPSKPLPTPSRLPSTFRDPFATDHFDVPITIGRPR
jgi:hypothetical protein